MAKKRLLIADQIITTLFYAAFGILILILFLLKDPRVWKTILVCGISFAAVSAFRHFYNAPRPYETDPKVEPPKPHCKKGHAFPSRHVFCAFLIASVTSFFDPLWGSLLFPPAIFLAWLRVRLNYHSAKDVICGAVIGILCAVLGFVLF